MKKIAILGSTGSIGTQTLDVVRANGDIEVDYYEGMTLGEIWGYKVAGLFATDEEAAAYRSEERRVGKECRSRWSPYH